MTDVKAVRVDIRNEAVEQTDGLTVTRFRWVLEQTGPVESLAMGPRTHADRLEAFGEYERARDALGAAARMAERERWLPLVADLLKVVDDAAEAHWDEWDETVFARAREALR